MEGLDVAKLVLTKSCVCRCHDDVDFTLSYILTNFNSRSAGGENFMAIGPYIKFTFKNIGMVSSETLYRNTFKNFN